MNLQRIARFMLPPGRNLAAMLVATSFPAAASAQELTMETLFDRVRIGDPACEPRDNPLAE